MAQPTGNQPLPGKEQNLFRQVVKFYENKQYKKGLKAADQILKKFPDHGETLAMKGLTMNCIDKKEEAYELVRRGLRFDLKSHVCWHVYGLLFRSDRDYREAIKCYQNALKLDKDNIQILRDLALLQVQMRDMQGFMETRYQLLQLKPGHRNNWLGLALAHHLGANFDVAVNVLEAFEGTQEEVSANEAYEHSEMLLYKAMILEEGSRGEDALRLLEQNEDKIRDKLDMLEQRAGLLLKIGHSSEAEEIYRKMLASNPDHYRMHEAVQACLGLRPAADGSLTPDQRQRLEVLYDELATQYPSSSACRRIPLDFKEGEAFVRHADKYVRRYLQKGIPSLFSDLKPLYRDPAKVALLGQLVEGYHVALEADGTLPPLAGEEASVAPESPQTIVWTKHFLAQHYDRQRQTGLALKLIDEAITHTPSVIELYTVKAKIIKHAGDPETAAQFAELARKMDLADRYLNSIAVKALFQGGLIDQAERTVGMFTRDGDQHNNLFDMQHMWYEVHCGNAYLARRDYGRALKKFRAVGTHFADIHEDQFDFHLYCLRKMTLRAYISMLRMEDRLYAHMFYSRAAWGAIHCYLDLHDKPKRISDEEAEEALMAGMTPDERKKWKQKKKKEEKRKADLEEKEAAERARIEAERQAKEAKAADPRKTRGPVKEKDADPAGAKLSATEDPLGEATKLVVMLKEHAASRLETHLYAFEVFIRKNRALLALGAVQRAVALAGRDDSRVHGLIVRFALHMSVHPPQHPVVQRVVDSGLAAMTGGADPAAYNAAFLARAAGGAVAARAAAAQMMVLIDPSAKAQAVKVIMGTELSAASATHTECVAVRKLLLEGLQDAAAASEWSSRCQALFQWSAHFDGALRVPPPSLENGAAADEVADGVAKMTVA